MSNQAEKQNQGLTNLKSIYMLQSGGAMQVLLRDLRSTKVQMEDVLRNTHDVKRKKQIVMQQEANVQTVLPTEKVEVKPQVSEQNTTKEPDVNFKDAMTLTNPNKKRKTDVDTDTPAKSNNFNAKQPISTSTRVWNNNTDTSQKTFDNSQRTWNNNAQRNNQRPWNNNTNQTSNNNQRTWNNNQGNQRPWNNNNNNNTNNQRPWNNNNNQRPWNNNKPNSGNQQWNNSTTKQFQQGNKPNYTRDGSQRAPFAARTNNFVPSRGNSIKKFEPTESIDVLSQPERNFGNKNKSNRQLDEKKQANKRSLVRRNIIAAGRAEDELEDVRMGSRKLVKAKRKDEKVFVAPAVEVAVITTESVSVKTLSEKTGKPVAAIIKQLMLLGIMANINSVIDFTTAELVSSELGVTLEQKLEKTYEQQLFEVSNKEDDKENMTKRAPVVTVMGHVDHGKTSLLDAIRQTNVVSGEAGGITQKIGAYQVTYNNEKITFIDTPGHAAFTAMRARGAKVTDIAILVVAADDGIMPQTIEAINHIKAANVPMIVAINKMDKPDSNIDRVKQQLADNGVLPEEWGGDAILVPVSAKKKVGIEKLLENILLVAEVEELSANANTAATGTIIEAELDKNRGPIASVLIQSGTLKVGDSIMCGISFGKVRAMYDENGKNIKEAIPSTPVEILGFDSVPNSGEQVFAVNEKFSKQIIMERINKIKQERADSTSGVSLEDFMDRVNEGKLKALNIIIKADVQGSVEALKQSLTAIRNEEARVVCIHSGAGAVTESDLLLAEASGAVIINFNLKLQGKIEQIADNLGIQIKTYKVIYDVVDEITKSLTGMLTIKYEEKVIGHAEVRVMFKLSTSGVVCGSYITDGKVTRNSYVRVLRGNEVILNSNVEALKIQKDDKAEVNYGYECGIKLKDSTGVSVGDIIEAYEKVEIKRG